MIATVTRGSRVHRRRGPHLGALLGADRAAHADRRRRHAVGADRTAAVRAGDARLAVGMAVAGGHVGAARYQRAPSRRRSGQLGAHDGRARRLLAAARRLGGHEDLVGALQRLEDLDARAAVGRDREQRVRRAAACPCRGPATPGRRGPHGAAGMPRRSSSPWSPVTRSATCAPLGPKPGCVVVSSPPDSRTPATTPSASSAVASTAAGSGRSQPNEARGAARSRRRGRRPVGLGPRGAQQLRLGLHDRHDPALERRRRHAAAARPSAARRRRPAARRPRGGRPGTTPGARRRRVRPRRRARRAPTGPASSRWRQSSVMPAPP